MTDGLKDPESDEFKEKAAEVEKAAKEGADSDDVAAVKVKDFEEGSIIANLQYILAKGAKLTKDELTKKIEDAIKAGKLDAIKIDKKDPLIDRKPFLSSCSF